MPRRARLLIDRDYALFGAGLLAGVAPLCAFDLALSSLQEISDDR
jgi:hypothetical protein